MSPFTTSVAEDEAITDVRIREQRRQGWEAAIREQDERISEAIAEREAEEDATCAMCGNGEAEAVVIGKEIEVLCLRCMEREQGRN